ncbi:M28 family peptidase [Legionella worsleiensis]|uniref:Aminopeptidase n=1 Tax=Legionella worsleiensis TaxID=45076 RepID=A0A0W1AEW0_9GAMM|nr:M28 family peptidase [Legionella worsleiensis]KTD79866.1 aminopeptidase [Legionella worsleiensis]STY32378.1 aminopeptidase [Legionella worsleiensis]
MRRFIVMITVGLALASYSLFADDQSFQDGSLAGSSQAFVKEKHSEYEIKHTKAVDAVLKAVVPDNIWQTLSHLTSYPNRSATKQSGLDAVNWLKLTFDAMTIEYGRNDTESFFIKTGWYKQPSLVTVIGKDLQAPAIVIGAHMDTPDGTMPGADEGSGAATIMEAARVLLASDLTFKRPIYIIWYAAGTRNFAGSHYVSQYFQEKSIPVKAVIQFDMTGYRAHPDDPTMWIYTDYTDKPLSHFMAQLITFYLRVPVGYSQCGYECSDHVTWNEDEIATAFPSESDFAKRNPYFHSSSDTMDFLNLDHMTQFAKLAVALAIELAL